MSCITFQSCILMFDFVMFFLFIDIRIFCFISISHAPKSTTEISSKFTSFTSSVFKQDWTATLYLNGMDIQCLCSYDILSDINFKHIIYMHSCCMEYFVQHLS